MQDWARQARYTGPKYGLKVEPFLSMTTTSPISSNNRFGHLFVLSLNALGFAICLLGLWTSIRGNFAGRSLYVDEAMLAFPLNTRSLGTLTSSILPYNQTAPVGYLWIVKLLALCFGHSEVVLRSFSVFSYALSLLLTWWCAKYLFRILYPWMASAFLANMLAFLRYSNVFKPYEFEAVGVLVVLAVYALHCEHNLAWWWVAATWILAVLCGNPSCFMIASCLVHAFVSAVCRHDGRAILSCVLVAGFVGMVFVGYYLWWLRDVAKSDFMQTWWKNRMLSFWPLTPATLAHNGHVLMHGFLRPIFGQRALVFAVFLPTSVLVTLANRHRYGSIVSLTLVLPMLASSLKLFPMELRLWVFSFPLASLLLTTMFARFAEGRAFVPLSALLLLLVLGNMGIVRYSQRQNVYWTGEELRPLLEYVQNHLREDESVYVLDRAIPGVKYYLGYDFKRFGDASRDNVLWGSDTWGVTSSLSEDADRIARTGKCFLLLVPWVSWKTDDLLKRLETRGTVSKIFSAWETPLYYFEGGVPERPAPAIAPEPSDS